MNIPLLRQVQTKILQEPQNFNMAGWGYKTADCNTICCIAGWAGILSNKAQISSSDFNTLEFLLPIPSLTNIGNDILGLTIEQAQELFYEKSWDEPFKSEFTDTAKGSIERAQLASDYIDYFIKKHCPEIDEMKEHVDNYLTKIQNRISV